MAMTMTSSSARRRNKKHVPLNVIGFGIGTLTLFSVVSWILQRDYANTCTDSQLSEKAQFFADHPIETFVLMIVHAIPFALIPATMRIIQDKEDEIQKLHPNFDAFIMNMGLASVCFGLAMEFGWHVTTQWYYEGGYQILNFCFYFFIISGFALWADGFKSSIAMDTIFGLILLAATIFYSMGDGNGSKVPLYIGMTVTFSTLTIRGMEVFGKKMLWVPFFSIFVNLAFVIFGLSKVSIPGEELSEMNYIYHACHDLFGTELGVVVFAYFVATYNVTTTKEEDDDDTDTANKTPLLSASSSE